MEKIWTTLVEGTAAFVRENGFEKVVVAMSGGIDSSIVAAIGSAAVGPQNVLGVMMPSPYSSSGSITDARKLASELGIDIIEIPIGSLMTTVDDALSPHMERTEGDITQQNIQARIRAVLVMALCNKRNRMLLNTCNKSEDYVGYATLYGDSCGAVAPVGDLYKTQIWELAKWLNSSSERPSIPETCISKPPSAELCDNQLDTDSLPPYDILDPILEMHVDRGLDADAIIAAGNDEKTVREILRLVQSSKFKRDQAPPPIPIERDRGN